MQTLVYLFIGLSGLAAMALAYFGLTFTVIESFLTGLVVAGGAIVAFERTQRVRAEARMTHSIDELSKLMASNAHAGQVLSQRVNEVAGADTQARVEQVERDLSILSDIVQQVAEATAEVEQAQQEIETYMRDGKQLPKSTRPKTFTKADEAPAALSVQDVRKALRDRQLKFHIEDIMRLPQRTVVGHEIIPLLPGAEGGLVSPRELPPGRERDGVLKLIEQMAITETFKLAKEALAAGIEIKLSTRLSSATLADPRISDEICDLLDEGRRASTKISLIFEEQDWLSLNAMQRSALNTMIGKGVSISLDEVKNLRLNFAELFEIGVSSVRADAGRFIENANDYTDFHPSDVADYVQRYEIDLIMTGASTEQHVLSLVEDGVRFASGPHFGPQRPMPNHLFLGADMDAKAKAPQAIQAR